MILALGYCYYYPSRLLCFALAFIGFFPQPHRNTLHTAPHRTASDTRREIRITKRRSKSEFLPTPVIFRVRIPRTGFAPFSVGLEGAKSG